MHPVKLILIAFLLIGCGEKKTYDGCEITDIVQVSSGGFGASARCIYDTSCGKLNLLGDNICSKQIGDIIYKGRGGWRVAGPSQDVEVVEVE